VSPLGQAHSCGLLGEAAGERAVELIMEGGVFPQAERDLGRTGTRRPAHTGVKVWRTLLVQATPVKLLRRWCQRQGAVRCREGPAPR